MDPPENKAPEKSRSISPFFNDSDIDASSNDKKLFETDKSSSGPMNAHYKLRVKISHYEHEIEELRNTNRKLRQLLNDLEPLEKQLKRQEKNVILNFLVVKTIIIHEYSIFFLNIMIILPIWHPYIAMCVD